MGDVSDDLASQASAVLASDLKVGVQFVLGCAQADLASEDSASEDDVQFLGQASEDLACKFDLASCVQEREFDAGKFDLASQIGASVAPGACTILEDGEK